jgi:simple sugar transport system substrate-binding protein
MNDSTGRMSRREALGYLGAAGALGALAPWRVGRAAAADKLIVGVIYVGPRDDYGYNQAQAQAAAEIKKLPGSRSSSRRRSRRPPMCRRPWAR